MVVGQLGAVTHEALETGIATGQLRMHLQPLVGAHGRQCVGFEALVRWQHPHLGLVPPDRFIPLAEEGDLIGPLTGWVLEEALGRCAAWRAAGMPLGVSVNASARLLCDATLLDRVGDLLARHRLPAHALTLEVTESALVSQPAEAALLLRGLRRAGIRVSVDDFGTGYTSLAMLKQFEFDELKIDGSFVSAILDSPADAAIVRSILELGHRLGSDVVAERVEDEATAELLAEFGCDVLQGFHLGRPGPADDVVARVSEARPVLGDGLATDASGAVPAPLPGNEVARLVALHDLDVLDTAAEEDFDDVAAIAAAACGTPVGLVSFVDEDRQWFKARAGDFPQSTPRSSAFCAHTILGDVVMEVPDARADARFATNPHVVGDPPVRFYAGAPLITDDGLALGTLCVIDAEPRTLSGDQRATLERLARVVIGQVQARRTDGILRCLTGALTTLASLHRPSDADEAGDTVVRAARHVLAADGVTLMLSDAAGEVLYRSFSVSTEPVLADVAQAVVLDSRTDGATAEVIRSREPLHVADAPTSALLDPRLVEGFGVASVLYVPVISHSGVVGVLVAWWCSPRPTLEPACRDAAVLLAAEAGATLERLQARATLRSATGTDVVTGLANRRACLEALRHLPPDSPVALFDLDGLRTINELHGHLAGDHALKAFAAHLRAAVRNGDVVGRWGGEEFLVALPGVGSAAGEVMLARLRSTWRASAPAATYSGGLAVLEAVETPAAVLARAEEALRTAKARGRNRDVVSGGAGGGGPSPGAPPHRTAARG